VNERSGGPVKVSTAAMNWQWTVSDGFNPQREQIIIAKTEKPLAMAAAA
jgi:hypothetical protein